MTEKILPCRLCNVTPTVPEMWADASGNHSTVAILGCGCGVQVVDKMQNRCVAKEGDTGWSMLYGEWDICLGFVIDKWNRLHG